MKSRVLRSVLAISLFIFAMTIAAFARSFWRCEGVWWQAPSGVWAASYNRGRFIISLGTIGHTKPDVAFFSNRAFVDWWPTGWNRLGFGWNVEADVRMACVMPSGLVFHGEDITRVLWVPMWAPLAVTGACAAACGLPLLRARARRRESLCTTCGYDLRATPDRCPECGASAGKPADLITP